MLDIGNLIHVDFTKRSDYFQDFDLALDGLDATVKEILSTSDNVATVFGYAMSYAIFASCDTRRYPPTFGDLKACMIPCGQVEWQLPGHSVYDGKRGPEACRGAQNPLDLVS